MSDKKIPEDRPSLLVFDDKDAPIQSSEQMAAYEQWVKENVVPTVGNNSFFTQEEEARKQLRESHRK